MFLATSPKCHLQGVGHRGEDGHGAREVLGVCFDEWETFFLLKMTNLFSISLLIKLLNSTFFYKVGNMISPLNVTLNTVIFF